MSRIPKSVATAVQDRAGYECECCGTTISTKPDFHHRQARHLGGSARELDTAVNLLQLDHAHHMIIHAHPSWARSCGLIVPSWVDDVTTVPVAQSMDVLAWIPSRERTLA